MSARWWCWWVAPVLVGALGLGLAVAGVAATPPAAAARPAAQGVAPSPMSDGPAEHVDTSDTGDYAT